MFKFLRYLTITRDANLFTQIYPDWFLVRAVYDYLILTNKNLFIVNNEKSQIMCWMRVFIKSTRWHDEVALVFLLLTLNIFHNFSKVSIVDFEQVNVNWDAKH